MSWQNTRSTGGVFIGIGIVGILLSLPHYYLEPDISKNPRAEGMYTCLGICVFLCLTGLAMYVSAYIGTRNSGRPITRSSAIQIIGLILIVAGSVHMVGTYLTNEYTGQTYDDGKKSLNMAQDYQLRITDTQVTKITVPAGYDFGAIVEGKSNIFAAPCEAKYFMIYYDGSLYEHMLYGRRGKQVAVKTTDEERCWAMQAVKGQSSVGVNLSFTLSKQQRR